MQTSLTQHAEQQASNRIVELRFAFLGLDLFSNDEHSEKSLKSPTDVIKHVDTTVTVFTFFTEA